MPERSDYPPDDLRLTIDDAPIVDPDPGAPLAAITEITNAADAAIVADVLDVCAAFRAKIDQRYDENIARAHALHKGLIAEKRDAESEVARVEKRARDLLSAWAAREKERINAARVAAAAAHDDEIATLAALVTDAEATGDDAAAEAGRLSIAMLPPPIIAPAAIPIGINTRDTWTARVDNFAALVRAAVDHPAYLALLKPDQRALDAQARSLRTRLSIPGVTAVCNTGIARSRK